MEYRKLGSSGINASLLGMGCWAYGGGSYWGARDQNDINDAVSMALDSGINLFDTAEAYNDGSSEHSLGIALKGRRERAVIMTKVSPSNAYPATLIEHCEASLKRLGTDHIDVYMLHWPINERAMLHFDEAGKFEKNPPVLAEAMDAMLRLRTAGKILNIGVSNFGIAQLAALAELDVPVVVNEMAYNIVSRAIETEVLPYCVNRGISVVGYMALQQGLLSGKYAAASDVPHWQAHSRHYKNKRGNGTSRHGEEGAEAEIFELLPKLREIARELGISMPQLSLAWAMAQEGIDCTLVGSRNTAQLAENMKTLDIRLPAHVIEEIDTLSFPVLKKLGNSPDYYESAANSRIW